jgi:energy-coupling factor transporter transmembrane protein EcfT
MTPAENRRLAIASSGVLLHKTLHMSNEVYLAMQARGFRGEVYVLDDFAMRARDWLALAAFATLAGVAILVGR